jgi:hypothetical protein
MAKKVAILAVCLVALVLVWGSGYAFAFAAPPEEGPQPYAYGAPVVIGLYGVPMVYGGSPLPAVATTVQPLPGGYWYVYGTSYNQYYRPAPFGYGYAWYLHSCDDGHCRYYYYVPYGSTWGR